MRLGTSSPLRHSSAEEWAKNLCALGCSAVVFPIRSNEPIDRIDEYKNAAEKYGLMIAEVGIWRNALAADEQERRKNLDYCIEQLRLADYLGARCAVNVAGAFGERWDGGYKANFTDEAWKKTVSMVQYIIDTANVRNTYFTLEPMPWMIPTSPKEYLRLIEMVDRNRFAVHLDAVNMINSADRYFGMEEFINECAELLGGRIRSCHVKDIHLKQEYTLQLEECAPGLGEFPLRYYAEAMNKLDSDMPMILEHLNTDEEYLKYLAYLKGQLNGLYKVL
ncbi:sugar phosphate isomerase/epimerase family protein [Ruminococcus albus]|uniref:Sugar phosphate isomerase/epimerase n=1 Tax=Ruminococcus albus TaxID=1264 RepID=A0A1H7F9U2_RUMAL|nr:TIM barrel protein [Ruminococcus albus]SEK20790.1 Sugar phosphate isomerase/epimerase [Ruminococcus albus]